MSRMTSMLPTQGPTYTDLPLYIALRRAVLCCAVVLCRAVPLRPNVNEPYDVNVARQDQDTPWRSIKLVSFSGSGPLLSTDVLFLMLVCCQGQFKRDNHVVLGMCAAEAFTFLLPIAVQVGTDRQEDAAYWLLC